jgi:hypothetical protein
MIRALSLRMIALDAGWYARLRASRRDRIMRYL